MVGRTMGRGRVSPFVGAGLLLVLAACSKTPPAETPADEPLPAESDAEDESEPTSDEPEESPAAKDEEPAFRPGMSVEEAISAVPSTAQRIHIEDEALAAPLKEPEVYEPCKLKGHQHFTIRVAVWQGHAVGLDVTTKPADAELESCLRTQIDRLEWKDKVESLNTVEFSF